MPLIRANRNLSPNIQDVLLLLELGLVRRVGLSALLDTLSRHSNPSPAQALQQLLCCTLLSHFFCFWACADGFMGKSFKNPCRSIYSVTYAEHTCLERCQRPLPRTG